MILRGMERVRSLNKMLSSLSPDQAKQAAAVIALLLLAALAIAGPTGILAWNESANTLEERRVQIAELTERRDALKHQVDLLALDGTDPDLATELIRQNLNVVHPDEVVITLPDE